MYALLLLALAALLGVSILYLLSLPAGGSDSLRTAVGWLFAALVLLFLFFNLTYRS
jgi:hypothetical protein